MNRITPTTFWIAIACVAIVAGGSFFVNAQPAPEAPPEAKCSVAVVNVAELFKHHDDFKAQLEQMKVDVKQAEKRLGAEADEVKELIKEMQGLDAAEPLKQKLEIEIAERKARLELKVDLQKNEFIKQEAVLYAKVYNEIEARIALYCRARGITLALRTNELDKFDETSDRERILKGVNRQVVFQDNIDITAEIIKILNRPVEEKAL